MDQASHGPKGEQKEDRKTCVCQGRRNEEDLTCGGVTWPRVARERKEWRRLTLSALQVSHLLYHYRNRLGS